MLRLPSTSTQSMVALFSFALMALVADPCGADQRIAAKLIDCAIFAAIPLPPTPTHYKLAGVSFPGPAGSGWCVAQPGANQQRFSRTLLLGKTVSQETPIEEIMHTYILLVAVASHQFPQHPATEADLVRFVQHWIDLGAGMGFSLSGEILLADHGGPGERVVDSRVWPENGHGAPCTRVHVVTRQTGNRNAPGKVLTQPGEHLICLNPGQPGTLVIAGYSERFVGETAGTPDLIKLWGPDSQAVLDGLRIGN